MAKMINTINQDIDEKKSLFLTLLDKWAQLLL